MSISGLLFFQHRNIQKQAKAATFFYKKAVLKIFIHRKTPVLKSLLNKVEQSITFEQYFNVV